jgi:cellulose synthase/poly-beta-1,6-N-acetylglucosamine synthase-like glycosyltransferase
MIIILSVVTIGLVLGYGFILMILKRGLSRLRCGKNEHDYRVSIIIAARNEEQKIGSCIQALVDQSYPADQFEIIIVDDRSLDSTAAIVQNYCRQFANIRLLRITDLAEGISPKKNALQKGIETAIGEIILTTDADCIPEPGWVKSMVSYFEPEVGLVAGFSPLESNENNNLIHRLFTLDSLTLSAVAAGSFGMGKPLTCNGRNLAYRRETFDAVGGFKKIYKIVSGDDDLFLHLVRQQTSWKFRYAMDRESIVHSKAPETFKQFMNQRVRHASKGRHYPAWFTIVLAAVYLLNLNLLLLIPVSFFNNFAFVVLLACLLIKSLGEFILIYRIADLFGYKKILAVFPLAAILHPFYVIIFGLWGQLGKFHWKDETFAAIQQGAR